MAERGKSWYLYSWLQGATGLGLLLLLTALTLREELVGAVGAASPRWGPAATWPEALLTCLLFLALGSATILLSFRVHHYFITLDVAVGVACLFLFGAVPAAWVVVVAAVVQGVSQAPRKRAALSFRAANLASNCGNRVYRILAAGWVYTLCGGATPLREISFHPGLGEGAPPGWLAPTAAMATVVAVNNALFLPAEWAAGRSLRKFLRQVLAADGPVHSAGLGLAVVLAVVYSGSGLLAFLVLAALLLFVSRTLKQMTESRQALTRRLDELQTLNVVGEAICSTPSVEDLTSLVHCECRKILDFTHFDVALAEEGTNGFRVAFSAAGDGPGEPYAKASVERLSSLAAVKGKPLRVGTRRELQFLLGGSGGADLAVETASALCAPMMESDRVLGVVCIQHQLPNRYTAENLRALSTIAHQASVALQNLQLYRSATRDSLTDLYLRPVLLKRLEEELLRSRSQGHPVQLMVLDLDCLKEINDTYGHAAGDIALRQVADAVHSSLRAGDVAARFGGDEFVVLLPGVPAAACREIARRIQEGLRHLSLHSGGEGREIPLTVSIGLAGFSPEGEMDPAAVFEAADRALYEAKRRGRNRIVSLGEEEAAEPEAAVRWAAPSA